MNKVILIGRLTRDAEIRVSQGENAMTVARFSLAVDRRFKKEGQPTADFINCVAFGKTAQFIEKYVNKGTKLAVEGSWQTGSYTDKNGNKVYTNDCLVEQVEFAESKQTSSEPQATPQTTDSTTSADGFMNIPDCEQEELPFN